MRGIESLRTDMLKDRKKENQGEESKIEIG
jgi:hypothetical protein